MIESTSEDIITDYNMLRAELGKYNPKLNQKKAVLFISKADICNEENKNQDNLPDDIQIEYISSVTGENINLSIAKLSSLL